jgi:hypothetical protein
VSLNLLGTMCIFLILARNGGRTWEWTVRGEERIGMDRTGMADYYCSLNN